MDHISQLWSGICRVCIHRQSEPEIWGNGLQLGKKHVKWFSGWWWFSGQSITVQVLFMLFWRSFLPEGSFFFPFLSHFLDCSISFFLIFSEDLGPSFWIIPFHQILWASFGILLAIPPPSFPSLFWRTFLPFLLVLCPSKGILPDSSLLLQHSRVFWSFKVPPLIFPFHF